MRGIILAGGTGSRLGVLTKTQNKHMLPLWDRQMICWPLKTLADNGITDITIVSTDDGTDQLFELLEDGRSNDCNLTYESQRAPAGVADALKCALMVHDDEENIAVILGDNIFLPTPKIQPLGSVGARCYLYRVADQSTLTQFGVPDFLTDGRIASVEEKPETPQSEFAVTGLYVFGPGVWTMLQSLKPGKRGELEITDLLDKYAKSSGLAFTEHKGFWGDAGTLEGMASCAAACRDWSDKK